MNKIVFFYFSAIILMFSIGSIAFDHSAFARGPESLSNKQYDDKQTHTKPPPKDNKGVNTI